MDYPFSCIGDNTANPERAKSPTLTSLRPALSKGTHELNATLIAPFLSRRYPLSFLPRPSQEEQTGWGDEKSLPACTIRLPLPARETIGGRGRRAMRAWPAASPSRVPTRAEGAAIAGRKGKEDEGRSHPSSLRVNPGPWGWRALRPSPLQPHTKRRRSGRAGEEAGLGCR